MYVLCLCILQRVIQNVLGSFNRNAFSTWSLFYARSTQKVAMGRTSTTVVLYACSAHPLDQHIYSADQNYIYFIFISRQQKERNKSKKTLIIIAHKVKSLTEPIHTTINLVQMILKQRRNE